MNKESFRIPKMVELEITSKCTLACGACARTMDPYENFAKWKLGEMDISVIEKIAQQPSVSMLNFTGSYGDPIYHTRLVDIVKIAKRYNKRVHITTNGSYRKAEWWEELGNALTKYDTVTFSVDGLEHNNHVYRVNADWPSIETGMRTLAKHKNNIFTEWKWILFNHNENDVTKGYDLSKEIGIMDFTVVETSRWSKGQQAIRPYSDVLEELKNHIESKKNGN